MSRRRLLEVLSRSEIDSRLRSGRLLRVHRGVYRVGPVASPLLDEAAAVLAAGPHSVLSHRSAACLLELLPRRPSRVALTLPRGRCERPGLRVHRTRPLEPGEIVAVHGLPVTSACRTLLDLSGTVPARTVERALAAALRTGVASFADIRRYVGVRRRRPGSVTIRALLSAAELGAFTRSEAEERFLDLVRSAGLPHPAVNVRVSGHEVDFLWRPSRMVVEVDGYEHHGRRGAFESDRRRDQELAACGYRVVRITWRQLTREPMAVVARLAAALAA